MIAPAGSELDDEVKLMARVAGGDVRAFEEFYDCFASAAFSLAMRIVNDRGIAADVTQEAFLELWRNRARYTPERGRPRAWLLGIIRNRAIDAYRLTARRGGPAREEQWETERASGDNTEAETIARDESRVLRDALEGLPDEQLTVMDLAYFRGLTQAEIAKQLGVPLGTVKGRVRLALNHLKSSVPQLA
jgi:RNA polymerase sigma-70 factor (ECF subfamily)